MDLYDAAGGRPLFPDLGYAFAPKSGFETPPGYTVCGKPGQLVVQTTVSPSFLCRRIPIPGQVVPSDNVATRGYLHFDGVYYPGGGTQAYGTVVGVVEAPSATSPQPGVTGTRVSLPPVDYPMNQTNNKGRHLPHQLVPYAPTAPDARLGSTRFYTAPGFSNTGVYWELKDPDPTRGVPGKPTPWAPPKPGTKEKKGRIPRWFAELAERAWDVTEANDLAENLFECLPKRIQKSAPKTGRTHKGSWAGEGHRYTSVVDKARHVHRNLDLLDLDCSFRKVSCNHISDMLWGRFFGTVDAGFQRGGVSGYSFATRGSGADVTREEYDKFLNWIEGQPALDRLLKSLDCENLGRS